MSTVNGNSHIKFPKWAWATLIIMGVTVIGWGGSITSKLATIETRMATWDQQAALLDQVRTEQLRGGYTLYNMGDVQARLTKVEITLHRLEEDFRDPLRRKQ